MSTGSDAILHLLYSNRIRPTVGGGSCLHCSIHRWIANEYTPQTATIQFPQSPSDSITLCLRPSYLFERPFVPVSSISFIHSGIATLTALAVLMQTEVELALLLPLWACYEKEPSTRWYSLHQFLTSTASCLLLSCVNGRRHS